MKENRMSPLPRPPFRRGALAAFSGALAVAMLVTGCATTKPADSPSSSGGTLQTGPGVTATSITLGVLTDRTGPFAGAGAGIELGRKLFWDAQNAQGGVCKRKVEFTVKDHAYKTDQAVTAYTQIKENVLALDELLGSPEIAALSDTIKEDKMPTLAVSWSSSLLSNPYVILSGTTYDVEMINGLQWLMENKGLAKGSKVGHIYLEGDYGGNALAGSKAAAKEYGLTIVDTKVKATDTDLTAQVTALKNQGVKFVLLTGSSAQTASAVSVAEANGFDMTFLGSNPTFSPALLAGPAKAALEKRFFAVTSVAPYASTAAGPTKLRTELTSKFPDQAKSGSAFVVYGYGQGMIMYKILEAACKAGALTRAGVLKAFQSLTTVETDGLIAKLDYSKPGQIPARQVYVVKPDATVPGGLSQVQDLFAAPLATSFTPSS
jgi:ABC-type branched-subunit amino acid transport system substrate-binding protein